MYQVQFGPRLTSGVKTLIIINVAVYLVQQLFEWHMGGSHQFEQAFALSPEHVLEGGIWQLFTYQFLHDPNGFPWHLIINMYILWMFGAGLEEKWGKAQFIKYYLYCGLGAGFFIFLIPVIFSTPGAITLGASGAVFGVLLAYAIYWPDRQVFLMFIIPLKVKYLVLILGLVSLLGTFNTSASGGISHIGHLGGLITGYLYLVYSMNRKSNDAGFNLWRRYKNYRQRKLWLQKQQDMFDMEHMEDKVDSLLDKISRQGMKSLSNQEKKFLKKASETMDDDGDVKPGDVLKH